MEDDSDSNGKGDGSSDEGDAKEDVENAVDYCSCQLPVVLLVFVLVRLVALLSLAFKFRSQEVVYRHQQFIRISGQIHVGQRPVAAVREIPGVDAVLSAADGRWRHRFQRSSHSQPRCQFDAEEPLHLSTTEITKVTETVIFGNSRRYRDFAKRREMPCFFVILHKYLIFNGT